MVAGSLAEDKEDEADAETAGMNRTKFFFACSVVVQLMAVTQVSTSFWHRWDWWLYMFSSRSELCTEFHRQVCVSWDDAEGGAKDRKYVEYDKKGRVSLCLSSV